MEEWEDRSSEEANLFNPAFCASLLAKTVDEYFKKTTTGMPFALGALVLPIVLHRATREALPQTILTSLHPWIQGNKEHLVDFSLRVQRLNPITREAVMFGMSHKTLMLDDLGSIRVGENYKSVTDKRAPLFTIEAKECVERAGFVGRWFAAAGTTATIFAAWGVVP